MGQRVNALHSLLANHHAPVGFEATRRRLREVAGVTWRKKWSEAGLLEALRALEDSRATHLDYQRAFAERRRQEKASGRRQPTRGDLEAAARLEWSKDADLARTRLPSKREQRP
jgi:hypothetical protein